MRTDDLETLASWAPDELAALLRPPDFRATGVASPDHRRRIIDAWIQQLEDLGLLDGHDRNVLRHWRDGGGLRQPPQLSIHLKQRWLSEDRHREAELQRSRQERELQALREWLEQAENRSRQDDERRLLREYPVSYPAHLEVWRAQEEAERQERIRAAAEALRQAELQRQEQQRLEALRREIQAEDKRIDGLARAYISDPIGTSFRLTEQEFIRWCDAIAKPELVDRMTDALDRAGRFHRLPPWRQWLARRLAAT